MGEVPRGGAGPSPNEPMSWVQKERQKDLRNMAEQDHEAKVAHDAGRPRRRGWWPFGRRRSR